MNDTLRLLNFFSKKKVQQTQAHISLTSTLLMNTSKTLVTAIRCTCDSTNHIKEYKVAQTYKSIMERITWHNRCTDKY